ncbi:MAG TPA: hypothetical protein PLI08_11490, partial [Bacteroidia bacterium]|nr:hypothetical protein [Bacteroidia bacterium]
QRLVGITGGIGEQLQKQAQEPIEGRPLLRTGLKFTEAKTDHAVLPKLTKSGEKTLYWKQTLSEKVRERRYGQHKAAIFER